MGFVLGAVAAVAVLGVGAELFLRAFPPPDTHAYLGDASPLSGPYRSDPRFGAGYRSWESFRAENAAALTPFLPLDGAAAPRPLWAFFGNSFIQAPAMLADTMRSLAPDRLIFHLGRNEPLPLRMAQVELLLENGLRPERIFFAIAAVDLVGLGAQPLHTLHITARGALTYVPRLPAGAGGRLVRTSALARTAWFRAGGQHGNPRFEARALDHGLDPELHDDLARLFAHFAAATDRFAVPVTIILIPSHQQIIAAVDDGLQRALRALLEPLGYDVFDPRPLLRRQPARAALFVPDKHFSPAGNQLLAEALLAHVNGRAVARTPSPP